MNSWGTRESECLLKVQNSDGTWNAPAEFWPAYLRASAALALAMQSLSSGDRETAAGYLQQARRDVAESVARNVPGSAALRDDIERQLITAAPAVAPGEVRVPRSHAERYRKAARRLEEARAALNAGDPERALALAQEVLDDPEILPTFIGPVLILGEGPGGVERVRLDPESVRAMAARAIEQRRMVPAPSQSVPSCRPGGSFGAWPPVVSTVVFVLGGLWWLRRGR